MSWDDIKLVVIPIAVFAWALYWPILKTNVAVVWVDYGGFWWKVRGSFLALFTSMIPVAKEVWHDYGNMLIRLVIMLIKARLGVPAMAKAVKAKLGK
jgi:hypothetical protein